MKFNALISTHLVIICLAFVIAGRYSFANGHVVYEQVSVFDSIGVGGRTAQSPTNGFLPVDSFDNFSLSTTTNITGVGWQGFYAPDNVNLISQFVINIWTDSGTGEPDTLIFSELFSGNANETLVGVKLFTPNPPNSYVPPGDTSVYNYRIDFQSPFLAVENTTYWLQILPTVDFPPYWAWHFGSGGDLLTVQDFNGSRTLFPGELDLAFILYSENTEPLTSAHSGQFYALPDMNEDGIKEIGLLSVDAVDSMIRLEILNGKTRVSLDEIVWADNYDDTTLALHIIPDMNNNGFDEVGLFGIQDVPNNEGKPQMFVRDLQTGGRVNVYNWPANWKQVSALVLDDISGDGIAEIAIQGRFKEGDRPQLVVKNGDSGSSQGTFGYPNLFTSPIFYQHSDANGDGFAEVATFGRITRNNKIQVKITNGVDSGNRMKAYNFPDNWDNVSWHRLDDSNGDGIDDWGLFGISKVDGRPQLIVKDGTDPRGALRIHAWPAVMQNAQFFRIPDMSDDGVDEVAAAGRRSNNGRYQFQVQDGTDRNVVLGNHNLNLSLTDVTYHVLPDLSGDGMVEIGFMGINPEGEYELVIQDGDTLNGEYASHNLGSDWQSAPNITSLGDTDNDDLPDIVVYGQNASGEKLVITTR